MFTEQDKYGNNLTRRSLLVGGVALACPNIIRAQEEKILEFSLPQTDSKKDFLNEFSKLYRVKVRYNYYNSFDNLLVQIYKNEVKVDVILSNSFEASIMFRHKKLQPIPKNQIKTLKQLVESAQSPNMIAGVAFDEGRDYTFVLGHTFANVIYNKTKFQTPPTGLAELFPKAPVNYNLAWTSNGKHVVRLASKLLGYGFNNTFKKSYDIVLQTLLASSKFVSKFSDGMNDDLIANNFADVGMSYTTSSLARLHDIPNMGMVLPQNGNIIGEAVLYIPSISQNQVAVHSLYDFLSNPVINKTMVESAYLATPYNEVYKLTSTAYRTNPFIFPKNANKNTDEPYLDLGDEINKYIWEIWKQTIKSRTT